jgi:hypothetical protein
MVRGIGASLCSDKCALTDHLEKRRESEPIVCTPADAIVTFSC